MDNSQDKNIYVKLAKKAIQEYIINEERIETPSPLPDNLKKRAGSFVSLKKNGQLRGCIGTIQATKQNLAEEIISNAISAAAKDPRFRPVKKNEIDELDISVDILEEPEKIDSIDKLNPDRYGVIVQKGMQRGLLLPNLEGIDSAEEQVNIALQKAGLHTVQNMNDIELYRFEVTRYR
ncbi:MAG: AmmeMemoRadiSam system protein A [Bacillota bacterium]